MFIATPIGIFFAVLLDREMRGTRIYQSAFFIPVVLSLAVVGFIWDQMYALARASSTPCSGTTRQDNVIDWLGDREHQHLGRAGRRELAPRRLHHGPVPVGPEERRPDAA